VKHSTKTSSPLHFYKLQALGNDYILFDGMRDPLPPTQQIAALCRRRTGIGADGALLLQAHETADAALRIFNADGSEAEMCGNGIRCAAWYLRLVRGAAPDITLQTAAGARHVQILHSRGGTAQAAAAMGRPTPRAPGADGCLAFDLGNPHACFRCGDVLAADEAAAGKQLADSGAFPQGVNIGFWQPMGDNTILLRVFERGVGETAACGTGAVAAAAAAVTEGICCSGGDITVLQAGGALTVRFGSDGGATLLGEARFLFAGCCPFGEVMA